MEIDGEASTLSVPGGEANGSSSVHPHENPHGDAHQPTGASAPLNRQIQFLAKGVPIAAPGTMIRLVIITIQRNVQRAIDTRDHMAQVMRIPSDFISIVLSEDGKSTGTPGKVALYNFYQKVLLPNINSDLPGAELYLIAEDDARLDKGLSLGHHRAPFPKL